MATCDFQTLADEGKASGLGVVDEVGSKAATVYLLAQTLKALGGADYTDICTFANSLRTFDALPDYVRNGAKLANLVNIAIAAGVTELSPEQTRDAINCAHCCGVTVQSLETAEVVLTCLINTQQQVPCWVAREVYGVNDLRWVTFAEWLLGSAPRWFRKLYLSNGQAFARWISDKPRVKRVIRYFMDKVVE